MEATGRTPLRSVVRRVASMLPLVVAGTLGASSVASIALASHAVAAVQSENVSASSMNRRTIEDLRRGLREVAALNTDDMAPSEAASAMRAVATSALKAPPLVPVEGRRTAKATASQTTASDAVDEDTLVAREDRTMRDALLVAAGQDGKDPEHRRGVVQGALDHLGFAVPDKTQDGEVADALEARVTSMANALKEITKRADAAGRSESEAANEFVASLAEPYTRETPAAVALRAETKAALKAHVQDGDRLRRIVVATARLDAYQAGLEEVYTLSTGDKGLKAVKETAGAGLAAGEVATAVAEEAFASARYALVP